jgi:NAD(P)-dependent dehydrogenase (short-subunit alcohol dehydrogenase family)
MTRFTDKVAFVTGATTGIGRATVACAVTLVAARDPRTTHAAEPAAA